VASRVPENTIEVVRLASSAAGTDFRRMAQLHIESIFHGALPLLGEGFLAELYRQLASAPGSGVWAATADGQLAGFIVGCTDARQALRFVVMRAWFRLMRLAALRLASPALWKKLPWLVAYPFKSRGGMSAGREVNQPTAAGAVDAELLSMAVDSRYRGKGIGRQLVAALETDLLRPAGIDSYLVTTNRAEEVSNRFYPSVGFQPTRTFRHHDLILQSYSKRLPPVGQR